jgi:hypothetical protein
MKKKFTYKQIYRLLPVLLFVFIIIAYRLSVSKTIDAWKLTNDLSEKVSTLDDAPAKIQQLREQIGVFDNLIGSSAKDSMETHQRILEKTGSFSSENNIVLVNFADPLIIDKETYSLETNIVIVEGGFQKLVQYVYNLENNWKPGKVVSTRFFIIKDMKTQEKKLYANVYIQKVKKKQ